VLHCLRTRLKHIKGRKTTLDALKPSKSSRNKLVIKASLLVLQNQPPVATPTSASLAPLMAKALRITTPYPPALRETCAPSTSTS